MQDSAEPQQGVKGEEEPRPACIAEESFVAGYLSCLEDIEGPMTMQRTAYIWDLREEAARRSYRDSRWLDPMIAFWRDAKPLTKDHPEPKSAPREGFIYVFKDAENDRVKIGWTERNVDKRRREIEKMAGCHLEVLRTYPGTKELEAFWHQSFDAHRINGEWFRLSAPVMNWIAGVEYE